MSLSEYFIWVIERIKCEFFFGIWKLFKKFNRIKFEFFFTGNLMFRDFSMINQIWIYYKSFYCFLKNLKNFQNNVGLNINFLINVSIRNSEIWYLKIVQKSDRTKFEFFFINVFTVNLMFRNFPKEW